MTAVVGILNKTTVALAADSAATVTGPYGDKVYNHAHKLFNLSSYEPVGLMIYSSSELVGIPWETIIKDYRKTLGRKSFSKLSEYGEHFANSLNAYLRFITRFDKARSLQNFCDSIWDELWQDLDIYVREHASAFISFSEDEKNEYVNEFFSTNTSIRKDQLNLLPIINSISSYSEVQFEEEYGIVVRSRLLELAKNKEFGISDETADELIGLFYLEVTRQIESDPWTGIIISGFGTDEMFPSLISYRVGLALGNAIRLIEDNRTSINHHNRAAIVPYAQTNDMQAFLKGIDPAIEETIKNGANYAFDQFIESISSSIAEKDEREGVSSFLSSFKKPALSKLISTMNQISREQHSVPIYSTVALSSKEELAEIAESLISLTSLKRKFSLDTESVGGPVDVAVITKGEGFIWLKRKQYFKPELNLNYLSSVINKIR